MNQGVAGVSLESMSERARGLYLERHNDLYVRTDKWFASLIIFEWLASMVIAFVVSPLAWSGTRSYIHPHIWFSVFLGGVTVLPVLYLVWTMPGKALTRHTIAVSQVLFSALLIHLTGGRIETHFHVFGSLAFLAFYRDWRVLVTASIIVFIDHLVRGIFIPQSVYGVLSASPWRSVEHAAWVVFEDVFLIKTCLQNKREMMLAAYREDQIEISGRELGELAEERSRLLDAVEAKYGSLCDVSPVGIFQNSSDGKCIYVNKRLQEIYALDDSMLLEHGWQRALHPIDKDRVIARWFQCVEAREDYRDEFRIILPGGEVRWTKVEAEVIADGAGTGGYVGTVDDISDRVAADNSLRMQYQAAKVLSETRSPLLAGAQLLQALCQDDDWDIGAFWILDRIENVMKGLAFWSRPGLNADGVRQGYETMKFEIGQGFVGSVWRDMRVIQIRDLDNSDLVRKREVLQGAGIKSGIAFPIVSQDRVIGVMQFFSIYRREVRPEVQSALESIGQQFGQFLKTRESELSVARTERKMAAVLRSALDAFITTDADGLITDFNQEAERVFGCRREETLGRSLSSFIKFDEWEDTSGMHLLSKSSGDLARNRLELIGERSDGTTFPIELTVVAHEEESGLQFSAFIRDISERKGAEKLTRRLAAIVESSCDAIIGVSPDGFITSWNPGAEQLYGFGREAALNQGISLIIPVERQDENSSLIARIVAGESVQQLETMHQTIGSGLVDVSLSASPLRDSHGNIEGVSIIARDITERKAIEKRISEFYSTVSHELRTPLTSIRGALSLIDDEIIELTSDEAREMINIARKSSERLVRLINDILDLKKIEAGKLELHKREITTDSILTRSIEAMEGMARELHVQVKRASSIDARICADPDRIQQVITNLISNALKYSSPGSVVLVSVDQVQDGLLRISVTDEGPGIDDEHHNLLFGRFQQVDSSDTRPKEGTGLGLAISKSIVEQHGGEMSFYSKVGVGSTFWFSLPSLEILPEVERPSDREATKTVLVVEDDIDMARFVMLSLSKAGFSPLLAGTRESAIASLQSSRPDVVLLDLSLPDGSGLDVIEYLRGSVGLEDVPIVVMTGLDREDFRFAPPLVFDWFFKPFDFRTLIRSVQRATGACQERKVLVVEDDPHTRAVIIAQLKHLEAECFEAENGLQAVSIARSVRPNVIVLDVNIPHMNGFEVVGVLQDALASTSLVVYSEHDLSVDERERLTLGITRHLNKSRVSPVEFVDTVKEFLGDSSTTCLV